MAVPEDYQNLYGKHLSSINLIKVGFFTDDICNHLESIKTVFKTIFKTDVNASKTRPPYLGPDPNLLNVESLKQIVIFNRSKAPWNLTFY